MRYGDMIIQSMDLEFIEKLSDENNINYYDADIVITSDTSNGDITNQVIYYVLCEMVDKLVLESRDSYDIKDMLIESIYCNCIDSGFDMDINRIKESFPDLSEDDIQEIESIL